ncbi:MAG: aspartate ammonia-lyase [Armatimonadetes bacterium]|nr:aspartate ammonia-lyase [Armatimonadota bacterium]
METRTEHDLLGAMEVPSEAYYGIHTLRARANFDLSGIGLHPELIRALADVKKACALANLRTGHLDAKIANAISAACDEIASGSLHDQFITDVFQGGAGTSANMNANEVIANRAIELLGGLKGDYALVHPLDHVNLSQSTNDVFPTAVKLAAIRLLIPASQAMTHLQKAFQEKENEFAGVLKIGRTEMQDAVPITLGQEFAAWAQAAQRDWWRLYKVEERLRQVNLGGTAVGTGLNADRKYVYIVVDILRQLTNVPLARAENMIDVTQNADAFVEVSGLIKTAAVNLAKIAGDLRILSSGPKAGFGEIKLPSLQAGSSIMPGKVNPVVTEAVSQAAFQIMANDNAITLAAMNGQLELNAFLPMLSHNLFQSLHLLRSAADLLADKCVRGIEADEPRCRDLVEHSFAMLTALSPYIGYESASDLAREASESGKTIREVALKKKLFTKEQLDLILSTVEMTKPGIAGLGKGKVRPENIPPTSAV